MNALKKLGEETHQSVSRACCWRVRCGVRGERRFSHYLLCVLVRFSPVRIYEHITVIIKENKHIHYLKAGADVDAHIPLGLLP